MLAGGLVLGVGAAITLAAWTDNVFAKGVFGSGTFGIEGSANGAGFAEHDDSANPATLAFEVDADALSPGDTVYASFAVQLIDGTTNEAEVVITTDDTAKLDGTAASFVYTTDATCDSTTYAAGTDSNVAAFDLTAVEDPTYLCFAVTADSTLEQGETGSFLWTFTATSGDPITVP
jgi:predicted ribosomally synthesized peptide with SipW-like signal peptide